MTLKGRLTMMVNITLNNRIVKGIYNNENDIDAFLGIRYADLKYGRFKHSELITSLPKSVDATFFNNIPPQPYNQLEDFFSSGVYFHFNQFTQDEDCLYLNIWRRHHSQNKTRPVIIYFYGGGFVNGHGSAELYQPQSVVEQEDVIVVTFNYRLGSWGFLDWSFFNSNYECNNGLSDQINAIKWVHHHIKNFGGDPNNVTLMGQSAGSMSIMALMQLPETESYFHKVMLLSGTLRLDSRKIGYEKAQNFSEIIAENYPNSTIDSLTTENIMNIMNLDQTTRGQSKGLDLIYAPIQTSSMTMNNPNFSKPIFVSYTQNEGDIYIKSESRKLSPDRFVKAMAFNGVEIEISDAISAQQQSTCITDYIFQQPAHDFLKSISHNPNRWLASFQWHQPNNTYYHSAYHILDIVFWFGHLDILKANGLDVTTHERELSMKMIHDLAYFARFSKMPWLPYQVGHTTPHIYD